jgi:hypothetical protein
VRWAELCRDFERALEFDQSALFKMVYEASSARPAASPSACWSPTTRCATARPGSPTDDVRARRAGRRRRRRLRALVVAAHPALLGFDDWAGSAPRSDITDVLRGPERHALAQPAGAGGQPLPRPCCCRACWRARPGRRWHAADRFRYREHAPGSERASG